MFELPPLRFRHLRRRDDANPKIRVLPMSYVLAENPLVGGARDRSRNEDIIASWEPRPVLACPHLLLS